MRSWCFILSVMFAASLAGCQLGGSRLAQSQSSYDQQVEEILKVVPIGTDRAEVVRRLEQAGVEGSFGISQSTYYCNLWKHENGKRSRLDVALLFNDEGRFYDTRHGDTAFAIEKPGGENIANRPTTAVQGGGSNVATSTTAPPAPSTASVRSGTREPFRQEK